MARPAYLLARDRDGRINMIFCENDLIAHLDAHPLYRWKLRSIEGGIAMPTDYFGSADEAFHAAVVTHRAATGKAR